MLNILRRLQSASGTAPAPAPAPADDVDARLLLASPLNDPDLVERAFGGLAPPAADVRARYLDVPLAERPRLSLLFDPDYYRERNEDVAAAGIDPYVHFLSSGMLEGRDPHPLVDLAFLRAQREEGADWDIETLAGVLRSGDYRPHPLFDARYYLASYDDIREAGAPALEHFLRSGAEEGRRPNRFFDPDDYLERSPDVAGGRYAAFVHFVRWGDTDGRSPGPGFDGMAYRRFHPELEDSLVGSLAHYLTENPDAVPGAVLPAVPVADEPPAEPEEAAPQADHFVGSFDAVVGGVAMGWAYHTREPGDRLLVEIVADDEVVGRGCADGLRADLREQGIGDGAYHFAIRLTPDLADGQPHPLRARVATAEGVLLHGAHVYQAAPPAHPFDLVPLARSEAIAAAVAQTLPEAADAARISEACLQLAFGDVDEALDSLRTLQREHPDDPLVQLKLGEADMLRGRFAEACAPYTVASQSAHTAPWAWLGLGNARRMLGDWEAAESHYEQGLALAPELAPLRQRLDALRSRSLLAEAKVLAAAGDLDRARGLIVRELMAYPDEPEVVELAITLLAPAVREAADPLLADAHRALALLEAVMAHAAAKRGDA